MESLVPHLGWLAHPAEDEVARFLAEGWFEYREQAFCWMYLREGDTVIDAGAHFGLYAALAGRLTGGTGRVLAVEANPDIARLLAENLTRHGGGRDELILAALASRAGEAEFFSCGGVRAAYSSTVAERPGASPCRVRALALDDLCRERAITRAALVKLDVEGDEIEVLRGAREAISRGVLPLWMIEFAEANLQRRGLSTRCLFDEITSLGYTVCRFDELSGRLAPAEWNGPVWYDNYFATTELDEVNRRLSECGVERATVARDILRRGAAAAALRDSAEESTRLLAAAEEREATAAQESARLLAASEQRAAAAEEYAREADLKAAAAVERATAEKAEAVQRIEAAGQAADAAGRRAEEASKHIEESWRRIGEANWRADQAVDRAETAAERAQATYRRLEVADRRTANARHEADMLKTRLRELLSRPRLARVRNPEWAESFLASGDGRIPPPPSVSDSGDPMHRALYHLTGRNFRPRTVLDAGAGKGYWSLNTHTFFPDAEYYMVDPLDENEEQLRQICERNPQFHFLKTALGDKEGSVDINARPFPQHTVDGLVREGCIASPELVKIEVQGYELKVLTGAEGMLETAEALIVQVNLFRFMPGCPLAHEVIGFLAARGFVLFDLAGSLRRPFQDDLAQLDLVFVPARSGLVESPRWA